MRALAAVAFSLHEHPGRVQINSSRDMKLRKKPNRKWAWKVSQQQRFLMANKKKQFQNSIVLFNGIEIWFIISFPCVVEIKIAGSGQVAGDWIFECNQILSFVFLPGNCRWTTHSSSRSFSSTNASLDTYYVFTFKVKPLPLISFSNSMWRMCPKILV